MAGRMLRAVGGRIVLVATLLLSGCWLQVGADGGHTRFNWIENGLTKANVESLHEEWSVEVPGNPSQPIVSGGRAFVTHTTRGSASVRAVDVATGATVWDQLLAAPPPVAPVLNLLGTPVAFVGDELWTGAFTVIASPRGVGCGAGSDVLDPATGTRKGTMYTGFPSPAVSSGTVVARTLHSGCPSLVSSVLEVSRPGPDGWVTSWQSQTFSGTTAGTPMLTGDHVVVTHEATVNAFAVEGCGAPTCSPVWTTTFGDPVYGPVAAATGPIFVESGQDLVALDRGTGAELWRAPLGGPWGGVALADGTVYVSSLDESRTGGQLLAYRAGGCGEATCEPVWTASFSASTVSQPTVGGGVVYVATGEEVLAFDTAGCEATTCDPLVRVPIPSTEVVSLALAQGRLFVAGNGRLTALAPDPG